MISKLFDLDGKIALITGSSRGIGYQMAMGLAQAGATVVINGLSETNVVNTVNRLNAAELKATGLAFNVTETSEVDAAIANIEKNVGPIDILINNAGIQRRVPLLECADETFREVLETNLESVFKVSRAVAKFMVPRQRGKIINTCSVQSELGRATIAPYAASKGGVKMLTKNMCAEWAKHNIQVNGIGPGYFATELTEALVKDEKFTAWLTERTPAGRWGNVSELIGSTVFLSSDASNFVNGHILYVDGGMTAVV